MSRPKKGEKGYKKAVNKWRATMLEKFGSEEALREFQSRAGRKGGLVKTPTGGFGSYKIGPDGLTGRERARLVGAIGGLSRGRKKEV